MIEEKASIAALYRAAGQELEDWANKVEDLGAALCVDAQVVSEHFEQLQGLDLLTQTLRELAKVITSTDPLAATHNVCVQELQQRLVQATLE
ncbi:MAG: hypothetical protein ABJP70_11245 [Erythrobacter sp.]